MYRYDEFDHAFVAERVAQFRDQVRAPPGRRADRGRVPAAAADERPLSAAPRLHAADRHPLWRAVDAAQMRQLAWIAERWDQRLRPFHHAPEHPVQLAEARRHAPTSWRRWPRSRCTPSRPRGNCIRNVTTDQWAGAAADEVADPRPGASCCASGRACTPEFSFLPRKFKIAVTGAPHDRAAVKVHDIGLRMHRRRRHGRARLRGDRRRRPGPHADDRQDRPRVPAGATSCCPISTAIMRVYNLHGRRDNKYKARIKILVHELGRDEFRAEVEAEFARPAQATSLRAGRRARSARIAAYFAPPAFETLPERDPAPSTSACSRTRPSPRWARTNVAAHKVPGYAHRQHLAEADRRHPRRCHRPTRCAPWPTSPSAFSLGEIRVTHHQNLVLPHVPHPRPLRRLAGPGEADLATPNLGPGQRHHRLPRHGLLLAGDGALDPGRPGDLAALRRARPAARRSARWRSTSPAASMPAAITMSAISASWASISRARNLYQVTLGGSPTRTPRSARIIGPGFAGDAGGRCRRDHRRHLCRRAATA